MLETPSSPTARILASLIIVSVTAAIVWSWFGRIDTYAVVQGKIIPVGKVQVIEPLITGTVQAIHVQNGDHVAAGQTLVELDPSEHEAERRKIAGSLSSARVSAARLAAVVEAVAKNTPPENVSLVPPDDATPAMIDLHVNQMRQSIAAFQAEQTSLEADIAQKQVEIERASKSLVERRKLLDLTGEKLAIFIELEERGVGIKSETISARQSEQDQLMSAVTEEGRIAALDAAIDTLRARLRERREAYLDRVSSELVEVDRNVGILEQDLSKAELFERASVLKSPVAGRVQQLEVNTLGQVVQTGQEMMVIVPDGTVLEIDAMLANKDKGFVREGQEVRVKLEAFPFTRYGTLSGKVRSVSNDAIPTSSSPGPGEAVSQAAGPLVFPVRIALNGTSIPVDDEDVALTPGMSVSAEVKTGDRRVIEFLLDPLMEMRDEAFHER